jgi:hypothetical protein
MDKQPQTLEEKIKLSEELVDKYLDEIAVTAAGVMAATGAVGLAQGLGHDAVRVAQWMKKKAEEKKQQMALAKQQKMKEKEAAQRQQNTA